MHLPSYEYAGIGLYVPPTINMKPGRPSLTAKPHQDGKFIIKDVAVTPISFFDFFGRVRTLNHGDCGHKGVH